MSWDGINGWLIQTLLRGENDSKQSDEIQAIIMYYPTLRVPEVFLACTGNFRCWPKADISSETELEKSLAYWVVLSLLFSKQD